MYIKYLMYDPIFGAIMQGQMIHTDHLYEAAISHPLEPIWLRGSDVTEDT